MSWLGIFLAVLGAALMLGDTPFRGLGVLAFVAGGALLFIQVMRDRQHRS